MRHKIAALKAATLIVLMLGLTACGAGRNPLEVRVQRCPAVAVMGGTGTLTRFEGEGRDVGDVALQAAVAELELDCDQRQEVVSEVTFRIVAERGPALPEATDVALPYFVAVVRDNSEIVAKKIFDARLSFGPGEQRAATREVIVQRLPTIEQARRYDYEILVGFQLTPEEVAYNLLR